MENIPFLISLLIFVGVILSAGVLFYFFKNIKERRDLIRKIKEQYQDGGLSGSDHFSSAGNAFKKRIFGITHLIGNLFKPKSEKEVSRIKKTLMKCGYRSENAFVIFFGFKVFSAALLAALFILSRLFIMKPIPLFYSLFFLLLCTTIGFYLPDIFLHLRLRSRKRQLLQYFPDALDLMVICVEAGMGVDAAIKRVGDEMALNNKVVSEEFRLLSLELRAGKQRHDALKNLALRTDLEDIHSLVTLLIQTDKFGTSIAQALRVYADSMRTKRFQRAEEMATKLPVKLVFPLILFIFPSLFVAILGPAMIRVYRTFLGH